MSNELAMKSAGEVSDSVHAPLTPIVPPESDQMLSLIERVALNPDADVEKMKALLDMRRGEEDRVSEREFYQAMNAAQAEMGSVLRDKNNSQTKSKYATLEAIAKAIRPVWTAHGFAMSFGSEESPKSEYYRVTCRVSHSLGHYRDYHADIPVDATGMAGKVNKTKTHAFGSTMSYGRRYLTLLIFDIATSDDDDGQAAGRGETISSTQVDQIRIRIAEVGGDEQKFCAVGKVQNLEDILASDFDDAMKMLDRKAEKSAS